MQLNFENGTTINTKRIIRGFTDLIAQIKTGRNITTIGECTEDPKMFQVGLGLFCQGCKKIVK